MVSKFRVPPGGRLDSPITILNHLTPNSAEAPPTFFAGFLTAFFVGFPNLSPSESSSLDDKSPFLSDDRDAAKLVFAPCSEAKVWNVVICVPKHEVPPLQQVQVFPLTTISNFSSLEGSVTRMSYDFGRRPSLTTYHEFDEDHDGWSPSIYPVRSSFWLPLPIASSQPLFNRVRRRTAI